MARQQSPTAATEDASVDISIDLTAAAALAAPTFTLDLVRASDQLRLRFEFVDLDLLGDQLQATSPDADPAIRVWFGPQHTAEAAIATGDVPGSAPVEGRTAGDSMVVFAVQPPLAFDLDTLLDLGAWNVVVASAEGDPPSGATRIEAPQALVVTPDAAMTLTPHSGVIEGIAELWTARFDAGGVTVVENRGGPDPALRSPTDAERDDLVVLTTQVAPVEARRLWLSLHGAFLDLLGEWDDDDTAALGTNVVRWLHRAVTGRDLDIEVTTRGFLAPFGHRAAMVTITERRILPDIDDEVVAALVQETYLTVTEPTVTFPTAYMPNGGRGFPFSQVTALGATMIPVGKQQISWTDDAGISREIRADNAWNVVDADGQDLVLAFTAVDRAGNPGIAFDAPVGFVEYENAFAVTSGTPPANLADYYADDESADRRTVDVGGASIAWADASVAESGQTVRVTDRIRLTLARLDGQTEGVTKDELVDAGQPNLFPVVERAWLVDPALAAASEAADSAVEVTLHERWLSSGNEAANFDLAYLRLAQPAVFSVGEEGRAAVALDLSAEVFNQTTGVGPDLPDAATPWDPASALGDASRVLGSIPLAALIGTVDITEAVPGLDIPGLDIVHRNGVITSTFSYTPELQEIPGFLSLEDDAAASIVLESQVSIDGSTPPSAFADIEVRNFALTMPPLLPAVTLYYNRVRVYVPDDGPVDVDYDLDRWELGELLAWVQPLLDKLEAAGATASVEIIDDVLEVEFGLAPPEIKLGVLSIRNFEIGAAAGLPLDGAPISLGANVGRPERPVEITLLGFEGSFYLVVGLGGSPTSLQDVAIAAEMTVQLFGIDIIVAEAAIDLGIAGWFMMEDGSIVFGGSVTLEGVIDVLGIISVSAGIVGSVAYLVDPKDLIISGRITYAVDTVLTKPKEGSIPLGQITYSLGDAAPANAARMAASEPAGDAAPSFSDRFALADWREYTGAFA